MKNDIIPVDTEFLHQLSQLPSSASRTPGLPALPSAQLPATTNALEDDKWAHINPIEDYLKTLKSPKSKNTQRNIINNMLRRMHIDPDSGIIPLPWDLLLSPQVLVELLAAAMAEEKSESYRNNMRAAFRGMARSAYMHYLLDPRQLEAIRDHKYEAVPLPPDRPVLDPQDIEDLVEFCLQDDSLAGLRDACLTGVAFSTGLRVSELAAFNIENFTRGINDLSYFRYRGKGSTMLEKYVAEDTQLLLEEWLKARADAGGDPNAGHIFYAIDRHSNMRVKATGMTPNGIYDIFSRRSKDFCDQHLRPHDFRRSIITWLLDEGRDAGEVAMWSGHKNVKTLLDNYDQNKSRRRMNISASIKYLNKRRNKV